MIVLNMLVLQVLIATSTLAWGVNFPAHLVVVKGTEYYDGKTRRYVDFPITGNGKKKVISMIKYSKTCVKQPLSKIVFQD